MRSPVVWFELPANTISETEEKDKVKKMIRLIRAYKIMISCVDVRADLGVR